MGGMAAWLASETIDPERTLVLGLDTIGSGEPVVLEAEGGLWPVRYRDQDVALAERAGLRRWRLGAWTDPVLAALQGIPALSILSVRDGGFPNYHLPSDTPDERGHRLRRAVRGRGRRSADPLTRSQRSRGRSPRSEPPGDTAALRGARRAGGTGKALPRRPGRTA